MDEFALVEQSNLLITSLTFNAPQLFIVIETQSGKITYCNYAATLIATEIPSFLPDFQGFAAAGEASMQIGCAVEFRIKRRYYSVVSYPLFWKGVPSRAFLLNDVSEEREPKRKKNSASQDIMTQLLNRLAGMMVFNKWLDAKKEFLLCFANLDNLRFINEAYGRDEGDLYITRAADILIHNLPGAVISRAGGDEFMILCEGMELPCAEKIMSESCLSLRDEFQDKPYYYNISYGFVEVHPDNTLPASALLGAADTRMWEAKAVNKKTRLLTK